MTDEIYPTSYYFQATGFCEECRDASYLLFSLRLVCTRFGHVPSLLTSSICFTNNEVRNRYTAAYSY